jgi:hypothetical protein
LAVVRIELPAVVGALDILTVEVAAIQRHSAVRAGIAQGKRPSGAVSAHYQRNFQQRGFVQLIAMHPIRGQSAVPEAGEHQGIRSLSLRSFEFGHGKEIVDE